MKDMISVLRLNVDGQRFLVLSHPSARIIMTPAQAENLRRSLEQEIEDMDRLDVPVLYPGG